MEKIFIIQIFHYTTVQLTVCLRAKLIRWPVVKSLFDNLNYASVFSALFNPLVPKQVMLRKLNISSQEQPK
jgi:hypothetical protein